MDVNLVELHPYMLSIVSSLKDTSSNLRKLVWETTDTALFVALLATHNFRDV